MVSTAQPKITYFQGYGRAEFIRMMFYMSETPFENNELTFEDWPAQKGSGYFDPFQSMPVLEMDGVKLM